MGKLKLWISWAIGGQIRQIFWLREVVGSFQRVACKGGQRAGFRQQQAGKFDFVSFFDLARQCFCRLAACRNRNLPTLSCVMCNHCLVVVRGG
jgi:hypothetical protein